jgi:hypothetical protein
MAITKEIVIDVETGKAEKNLNDVFEVLKDIAEQSKATTDAQKDLKKGVEDGAKSTKSLASGFKGLGLAMKATGIGLVTSAFEALKEIFMSNQKVADAFGAVMGTISVIFSQVTNIVIGVIEKVSKTTDGFDGLTKVIKGLITIGLTPLKLIFQGIVLTIDQARLAWEQSFFGDGDPKTIKELTTRIKETKDEIKEIGEDAVNAGKNVVTNLGKAISEVGQVVQGTIDGVKDISIEAAFEQSQANIRLQNDSLKAAAIQAGLVEEYDRQAETLRQIRDDESKSIEDRIKANNELGVVLNKQEKAMLAQANLQVQAARNQLSLNKNIENEVALIDALNNVKGVQAQITGLRSEQLVNENSLNKEAIEINKTRAQTESDIAINQALFDAQRKKDTETRLILERQALEQSKQIELERLQNNINNANLGTDARVQAESEFALKKQEIENAIIAKDDEINLLNFERDKIKYETILNNENESFSARLQALNSFNDLIQASDLITEEEKRKNAQDTFNKQRALETQRIALVTNTLGNISSLFEQNSKAGKAFAIAQALINTYQGVTAELATKTVTPFEFGLKIANIATTVAIGMKSVKDIMKTNPKGASGGSVSAPSGGGSVSAPMFNVVGTSGQNQIAQTLGQQAPVQAYVVSGNVSTAQSLDRNIILNASI